MTGTLSTKPLGTLMAEMADVLGLSPDLGLPPLGRVNIQRWAHQDGWRVTAYADETDAASALDTVYAWAAYAGGTVRLLTPYRGRHLPSSWQVSVETQVVIAEVPIEICANLDADAYAAAMAADRPLHVGEPVWLAGEVPAHQAALTGRTGIVTQVPGDGVVAVALSGPEGYADWFPRSALERTPVHAVGPFAGLLLGEEADGNGR